VNRRRFLTGKEVQAMMQAARHGQTGERDYCLILLAFRHGMRISELLDLHYRDLDLVEGRINIRRLKNGFSTVHPLMPMNVTPSGAGAGYAAPGKARKKPMRCLYRDAVLRFRVSRPTASSAPLA
jgi:integrase